MAPVPSLTILTAEQWSRLRTIFDAVLDLPSSERDEYVRKQCGPDTALLRHALSMIAALSDDTNSWLLDPVRKTAAEIKSYRPTPGNRLGPWQLVRPLGEGGMGEVWLAERADDQFAMKVAIKFVRPGLFASGLEERFRVERQVLASLEHPNIARLLDAGIAEGIPYLVMEYIEGEPISDYCEARKLTAIDRVRLFQSICDAVQSAHRNLVVHRDLKPANILVTAEGVPKLLDFGIAKLLNATEDAGRTSVTQRAMTPEYASPEQIRDQAITVATDVWGLGAVLYQLLTGRSPFRSEDLDLAGLQHAICERDPKSASAAARIPVEADVDAIVSKALRKEPEQRYESASALKSDLDRYLNGYPVEARKGSRRYRAAKFVRRHRLALAAAVVVTIAITGGVYSTLRQQRRAEHRFNQVRELTNRFLFEIYNSIKLVPGTTAGQKLIVERGLEYLNGLAAEAKGDLALQSELASAYEKIASIQQGLRETSLNDTAGSLVSSEKAIAIRENLVNADPGNQQWRMDLVIAQIFASGRYREHGSLQRAEELLNQALANTKQFGARGRTAEFVDLQIGAYMGLCRLGMYRGGGAATVSACQKEVDLNREFVQMNKNSPESVYQLGVAYVGLADALLQVQFDDPRAPEVLHQAEQANDDANHREPGNVRTLIEGALIQSRLAAYFKGIGNLPQAESYFREAVKRSAELARADPNNGQTARNLSIHQGSLADTLTDAGRSREALDLLAPALAFREKRAAKDATSFEAREDLSTGLYYVGRAMLPIDAVRAEATIFRSLTLREALAKEFPDRLENRFRFARALFLYAELRSRQGRGSESVSFLRKAEALLEGLQANGKLEPRGQKLLDNVRKHLQNPELPY